jgi:hypothetical protein
MRGLRAAMLRDAAVCRCRGLRCFIAAMLRAVVLRDAAC